MTEGSGGVDAVPMNEAGKIYEPVFIAASVAEAEFAERLLAQEEIEYLVRPQEFIGGALSRAAYEGVVFEVLAGQAGYCRSLFSQRGLDRGVVTEDNHV
jgi:hypothetical protein